MTGRDDAWENLEEPILRDLAAVGYPVGSLEELRESGRKYVDAIPVLLYWLPQARNLKLKEEVVRTLSVPWARPTAAEPILNEFRRLPPEEDLQGGCRWAMGNALAVVASDAQFDDLVDIVRNREHGTARQMVVLALGKSRRPEAPAILAELLDDREVDGHALSALRRIARRTPRSVPRDLVVSKLHDDRAWVRKEAQKLVEKLG